MNKGKPRGSAELSINDGSKVGELFTASSLEEYAELSKDDNHDNAEDESLIIIWGKCCGQFFCLWLNSLQGCSTMVSAFTVLEKFVLVVRKTDGSHSIYS